MKLLLTATAALLTTVSAFAADLPSKKSANAAPVAAVSSWTGVYGGLNVGYGFSESTKAKDSRTGAPSTDRNGVNGFIAGGQLGADYQIDSLVLGVAGDYDNSWASKSYIPGVSQSLKVSFKYVGTVRGRLGYAFSSQLLGYATAGAAFSKLSADWAQPGYAASQSTGTNGYVIGAGVEHKYTANISSFAEYRYYKYNDATLTTFNTKVAVTNSEVRAGVNYRF